MSEINVKKSTGELAEFDRQKLITSLRRAGASTKDAQQIAKKIASTIKDGDTTTEIYRRAFDELKTKEPPLASRYSLRHAVMELGPTGYPFERLVGKLFEFDGYHTEIGVMVPGHCVTHEVDVVADKSDERLMVECKFHNRNGVKSDIKTALYTHARFKDIESAWKRQVAHAQKFHQPWLVTNTKLTSDAVAYAECMGMKAVGWDYPHGSGLEDRINNARIHPVTALTELSKRQKQELLKRDIVLCTELAQQPQLFTSIGLTGKKRKRTEDEINMLCNVSR